MLTIIIPTKNRSAHLRRTLTYYHNVPFPYTILVLDSSETPHQEANRNLINEFQTYTNFKFMQFNSDISYSLKTKIGLNSVTTKYLINIGDDDYLILGAIKKGIEFLEANPDYSVVHGTSYRFYLKSTNTSSKIKFIEPYYQRSIEHETASVRLLDHLSDYATTFQSIRRSELVKTAYQENDIESLEFILDEMYLTSLDVIQGKVKCLPDLYMLREAAATPTREFPLGPSNFCNWVLTDSFRTPYETVHSSLTTILSKIEELQTEKASEIVHNAFSQWLIPYYFKDCTINQIESSNILMKKIRMSYIRTQTVVQLIIMKITDICIRIRLSTNIPLIMNYHSEFKPVKESIKSFGVEKVH